MSLPALHLPRVLECLHQFCTANTALCRADEPANFSPFHSSAEPGVSLSDYIARIERYVEAGFESVALAFVLVGRFANATSKSPSILSAHRLFLTALRIVTKVQHDIFRSNRTFARVGGIHVHELCRLEFYMLEKINFTVSFSQQDLEHTCRCLALACAVDAEVDVVNAIAEAMRVSSPHDLKSFRFGDALPSTPATTTISVTHGDDDDDAYRARAVRISVSTPTALKPPLLPSCDASLLAARRVSNISEADDECHAAADAALAEN